MRTQSGQRFGADSSGPCAPSGLTREAEFPRVSPGLSFLGDFRATDWKLQITAPLGRMTKYYGLLDIDSGSNAVFCGDMNGRAFLNAGESGFLTTLPVSGCGREFICEFTGASTITAICHTVLRDPSFCMVPM
jgi:hypothetical protein